MIGVLLKGMGTILRTRKFAFGLDEKGMGVILNTENATLLLYSTTAFAIKCVRGASD